MPYLEVVVDYATGAAKPGTVRVRPGNDQPATAFEAKIVCDSTGRIVVRQLDAKHQVKIVATAQWNGAASERKTAIAGPNAHQWGVIEAVLRAELATAATADFDRDARAEGDVPAADLPAPPMGLAKRTGLVIVGIVALLAIVGASIGWYYLKTSVVKKANGEKCISNRECGSNNCYYGVCHAPGYGNHNFADGAKCDLSSECASNNCSFGVCTR